MKAMLLAAGRGERLRPITDEIRKRWSRPAASRSIGWHLERLARAGCREAVINVSHLGERIVERLGDGRGYGLRLSYSRERERLETAGGIANALPLLGGEPFLLVNATSTANAISCPDAKSSSASALRICAGAQSTAQGQGRLFAAQRPGRRGARDRATLIRASR
jgi:dTDP-glucose pyrophosphorylase